MNYSSAHLVCFSPTHSSHLIGEHIIRGLEMEDFSEVDLTYDELHEPLCFRNTVVVIAVPVYGGRVAETALQRMQHIRGEQALAVPVVVYGNRDYDDALLELKDWSIEHGFTPIAAAAFVGEHSYSRPDYPVAAGRPDENDLEKARNFGFRIQQWLDRWEKEDSHPALDVKGNYPYKIKGKHTPQAPLTRKEYCTACGFCERICPVDAITTEEIAISNEDKCIKCCACVKQCPTNARIFETPFTQFLFENFKARKEPEYFFLTL